MNIQSIKSQNINFGRNIKKHYKNHNYKKNINPQYKDDLLIKSYRIENNKKTAMKQLTIPQRVGAILVPLGCTIGIGLSMAAASTPKDAQKPDVAAQDNIPTFVIESDEINKTTDVSKISAYQKKSDEYISAMEKEPIYPAYFIETDETLLSEKERRQEKINQLNQLLEENPELKDAYEDITKAVERFSEDMGEDGYKLINRYIEEYGEGKVDKKDVYKMLYIESRGKVYDDDGSILESECHAFGPFQITGITEEGTNERFGTDFDKKDPYDNIALHVLILKRLYDLRTSEIEEGKSLPTGDNLKHGIIWGYHDGAYADDISRHCKDYIETFDRLSLLDDYPELYDLMEGNLTP